MYDVVVGIDFGTSGCGYAYSFMNPEKIFNGFDGVDNKVPNEIILDDNENILEFGTNCSQYLLENTNSNVHYFKEIKMHLYEKKTYIKANNTGRNFPLSIVIQKILEKIKSFSEEQLKRLGKDLNILKIKWVVTVPAIWGDFQKEIMMECCINSGLLKESDDKSLFFALEPEAASLYCFQDNYIEKEYIKEGKYYIICDLGGGTGDIVFHLVGNNNNLEEITIPCGGNYGSNEIDKKIFHDIIYNIFGYKDFENLYEKLNELNTKEEKGVIYKNWLELERSIKRFKEGIKLEKVTKNVEFSITLNVFEDCFKNDNLENLINKYNSKNEIKLTILSYKQWIIHFPYKIIYNYIEKQAKLIAEQINNSLLACKKEINTIIFVGGYCENEVLISLIKNYLDHKIVNFLQPTYPCLAVMRGAVLFGINPKIINSRIAKYTIGQKVRNIWDDNIHKQFGLRNKIRDEEGKVYRCLNCFDKFFEKGEKIEINQEITKSYSMVDGRCCNLKFYKTLNDSIPILITEEGVEEIGTCKLDAGKEYPSGEKDIKVTLKFGGTFIGVKGIHVKSGKEVTIKLEFN